MRCAHAGLTAGRITADGVRTYTWNAASELVSIPGVAAYAYDGNGQRIKTVLADGTVEYALYDLSGSRVYTQRLSGAALTQTDYLDLAGVPLAEIANGNPTYLHPDLLGSPRLATNSTQGIVWREHYEPYGQKLNGVNEKVGYTGAAYDAETGLTYLQARYYDAQIGRFLSTDPVSFQDSHPSSFNRYAYANDNPYRYTDPTGRCPPQMHLCDDDGGGLQGLTGTQGSGSLIADMRNQLAGVGIQVGQPASSDALSRASGIEGSNKTSNQNVGSNSEQKSATKTQRWDFRGAIEGYGVTHSIITGNGPIKVVAYDTAASPHFRTNFAYKFTISPANYKGIWISPIYFETATTGFYNMTGSVQIFPGEGEYHFGFSRWNWTFTIINTAADACANCGDPGLLIYEGH